MRLPLCLRRTRWGPSPHPWLSVVIDREVVYSDMTDWRWFGKTFDFSEGR